MGLVSLLVRIAGNALALWVAATFVTGVDFVAPGTTDEATSADLGNERFWIGLGVIAALFTVVNMIVRPVVKLLSLPLILLSLGLFMLVINALMVWLTGALSERFSLGFSVAGFWPALWAGVVISIVNWGLGLLLPSASDGGRR